MKARGLIKCHPAEYSGSSTSHDFTLRLCSASNELNSVWKPLRGPLNDWPLAVCDTKSVNASVDYEPTDLLFPQHVTENFQVHHSPNFKWYYLSDQTEDEMIVFKQSDTDKHSSPGVAHSSFFNPNTGVNEPPRESIEARALVFYDN